MRYTKLGKVLTGGVDANALQRLKVLEPPVMSKRVGRLQLFQQL